MLLVESGRDRRNKEDKEYFTRIEPVLNRLQILLQQYQVASQYDESLKQYGEALAEYNKLEEKNKRHKHILYCTRYNLQDKEEDKPIINGNKVTVFLRDPTRLD